MIKEAYAAAINLGPQLEGLGKLGEGSTLAKPIDWVAKVISLIIGFLAIIAIIRVIFSIIVAGYQLMSAGGEAQKIQVAKQKLTMSFVGLLIVLGAVFVVSLIGNILFGIDILNLNTLVSKLNL